MQLHTTNPDINNTMADKPIELTIVREMRDILIDPDRWTKHTWARNTNDTPVSTIGQPACKWCLLGCLECVAYKHLRDPAYANSYSLTHDAITAHLPKGVRISVYNDDPDTTHQDIINLLDTVIETLTQ